MNQHRYQRAYEHVTTYVARLAGTVLLLLPALYNGYPIVNPDTATYLASGFKPETPLDRPITYGLLARLFSLNGLSLWLVVAVQAWIVTWLLFALIRKLAGRHPVQLSLLATGVLSLGSSLSWLVSQVQPDIYTPVGVLCMVLLLLGGNSKTDKLLLYALFFISAAVHLSHPVLFCMLSALLFLLAPVLAEKAGRGVYRRTTGILFLLAAASMLVMGSAMSKSKHVFFMGSLLEKGILRIYLADNCATKNYKLCAYKDALPTRSDDFIWDDDSPLYKTGSWQGNKAEFNMIIRDILTTPKYQRMYVVATARQACAQAVTFGIGDGNASFKPGSSLDQRIESYFPKEHPGFLQSRQNSRMLDHELGMPNTLFSMVVVVSLLALAAFFMRWKRNGRNLNVLVTVCLAALALNLLDCAAFAIVNGRFGCKMIWLLPFCALLYGFSLLRTSSINK